MRYDMEELLPVVVRLAEKLTGFESTSVTYETAEQLMGAVMYCINEWEMQNQNSVAPASGISVQKVYEMGYACTMEKVNYAMNMYHKLLPEFKDYGNRCLKETVIVGMPVFFERYDIKFNPQDTLLTLDYPILKDINEYSGIDKVYLFIDCIRLEQLFLSHFSKELILHILRRHSDDHEDMIENLCRIVLANILVRIVIKKGLREKNFTDQDYVKVEEAFDGADSEEVKKGLEKCTESLVNKYYGSDEELLDYLRLSINDITFLIKNAVTYHSLGQLF